MKKTKKSDIVHEQKKRLRQLPIQKTLGESIHFIKSQCKLADKDIYQGILSFFSFMYGIPNSFLNAYIKDQISPADLLLRPKDVSLKKSLRFIKKEAGKQNLKVLKGEELLCSFFYQIDGEEIENFLKGISIWSV